MGDQIKVSICIPVYKNADFLIRCVNSILMQDYFLYEIIITDDSPDDQLHFISKYDDRILYFKNDVQLGSPKNWNKAISLAHGEYIKIMHQDDYFSSSTSLSQFVQSLEDNKNSIFTFSACQDIGDKLIIDRPIQYKKISRFKKNPYYLLYDNCIGAPSVLMYRRNNQLSFDENLVWLVDIDFYIRLLLINANVSTIHEKLISIGISQYQITSKCIDNVGLILHEYAYIYKKYHNNVTRRILLFQFSKYNVYNESRILHYGLNFNLTKIDFLFILLFKLYQISIFLLKKLKRIFF